MISRFGLLALVVALLVGSSIAVDSLRHNRIESRVSTPQETATSFFEQEIKPKIDTELADNDDIIRRHYVVERQYYNVWVTQTIFVLMGRHFDLDVQHFKDQQSAADALSDELAETFAWIMYETRHYLRVKIREREEKRKCMKLLVAVMRARDKKEYGSPDGPTWDWLISRKLRKYGVREINKQIALEIVYSAAAPNDLVNSFIEWIASKTGGTMTDTERENLMRNSGISQDEMDRLNDAMKSSSCPRVKSSDKLPNENLVLDFALQNPDIKEEPDAERPLLVRVPSSDDLVPSQSPSPKRGGGN